MLPEWPARGAALGEGQYVISTGERVRLPWLADPASDGLALWVEGTTQVTLRRFGPAPGAPAGLEHLEPDSLLLVLHAAPRGTQAALRGGRVGDREIHADLPPGERMLLRYASIPRGQWLPHMAPWEMMTAADRAPGSACTSSGRGSRRAGERLAILLPRDPSNVDPRWVGRVSRWAADPVWSRPAPSPLSAASFVIPGDTVIGRGGVGQTQRVKVVPRIGGELVDAVVVVPEYNAERGMGSCDGELAGGGDFPFVSLALARYQDGALPGLELSPLVIAQMVQLTPDRTASIAVSGKDVNVAVRGVAASNRFQAGGGQRVRAVLERLPAGGSDLEWRSADEVELRAMAIGDEVEWRG